VTVLVLTQQFDPTADLVIEALAARGERLFRCDAADFPERLVLFADLDGGWTGELRTDCRTIALESVHAVYYRRPSRFEFAEGMSSTERRFAAAEARLGFGGIVASLPCVWLNHPHRISEAEYKPVQLAAAVRCGLRVPRTIVTNDPQRARAFTMSCPSGWCINRCPGAPAAKMGSP
jgi:hypothetical protein